MSASDRSRRTNFPGDFISAAQTGTRSVTIEEKKPEPNADESWMDILDLYAQDDHWLKLDLHEFTMDCNQNEAVINYIGESRQHEEEQFIKANASAVMEVKP